MDSRPLAAYHVDDVVAQFSRVGKEKDKDKDKKKPLLFSFANSTNAIVDSVRKLGA